MADLQTPFTSPACPTPGGSPTGGVAHSGGIDMADGRPESPNSSGLPPLPDTYNPGPGTPGSQMPMPPVASPGTLHDGD